MTVTHVRLSSGLPVSTPSPGVRGWRVLNTKNFREGLSLESEDGLEALKKEETNLTADGLEEK